MIHETGRIVPQIQSITPGRTLPADTGLIGKAFRNRQLTHAETMAECGDCRRCQAALNAGMVAGLVLPVTKGSEVVGVLEYYSPTPLYLDASRKEKFATIARIAERARSGAVATAELRQVADDRMAVTTVVSKVGAAQDTQGALRAALD